MKPSKIEMTLSLFGTALLMLGVFAESLGLSDALHWTVLILAPICFISVIVLRRRRRNTRLAAGLPPTEKPPTKRMFWLLLFLIVVGSLSASLWLPYTGTVLPTSTLVVTSVVSCVLAVLVFVLSWRYWNKKV